MGIAALKHEILVLLGLAHERSGCICFFMAVLTSYTRTYVYTMSDLFLHGLQLLQARLAIPLPTLFHPHSHRFDTIHQYIYLNQFILPFIASPPTLAFVLFKRPLWDSVGGTKLDNHGKRKAACIGQQEISGGRQYGKCE